MRSLSPARAARMLSCGDQLRVSYCSGCGRIHPRIAQRCRDRLCPLCSWRLSIQRFHEMKETIGQLESEINAQEMRAALLTLTIKNCKPQQLRATLMSMGDAWARLRHMKVYKDNVLGWARCTEITFNSEAKTMHPHFHILLLLRKDAPNEVLLEGDLRRAWQKAARLDYVPQIDVTAAYCPEGSSSIVAAAGEAFAYSIKPATVGVMSDYYLETFANQIGSLRLTAYGGIIKEARSELGIDDNEEKGDDHRPDQCVCGNNLEELVLQWAAGGYSKIEKLGGAA